MHTYGASEFATTPDGRRLHLMSAGATAGTGSPTVVFESGMSGSKAWWGLVQPAVAAHTRAVVYDRAGTGRSDDDTAPRDLTRLAADLGAVLDHLGPGPFVLVGHSWGGPVTRTLVARRPDSIAGLVLVDPTDENAQLYFDSASKFGLATRLLPLLARVGLLRRLAKVGAVQPDDVAAELRRDDFGPRGAAEMVRQLPHLVPGLQDLKDHPLDLAGVPVTLISGTELPKRGRNIREQLTAAHQVSVRTTLPGARLVEANGSGHEVMFTEPRIIVDEALRFVRS